MDLNKLLEQRFIIKKIAVCVVFFFCVNICAQEYSISYLYDAEKIIHKNSVTKQQFKPYTKALNNGFKNGVYWFKIDINKITPFILQVKNPRVFKTKLFLGNTELKKVSKRKFITYKLNEQKKRTYYLKVITEKEAFIPIIIEPEDEFQINISNSIFINGAYYGFALMILAINLFYFITFKKAVFLKYMLYNISITLSIFYSDGLFSFFSLETILHSNVESYLHVAVAIFGNIFIIDYLNIKHTSFLKLTYTTSALLLVSAIVFLITKQFLFFVFIEFLCLLSLILNWLYGVTFYKKTITAKIFVLAFSITVVATINFYLCKLFGFPILNNSVFLLKLGGIIEMVLFTYVLIYSMKRLKQKNIEMQKNISIYATEAENLIQVKKEDKPVFIQKEKQILKLLKEGKTNLEIATELYISVNTVKYHLKNIYIKLNVKSRKEITNYPF